MKFTATLRLHWRRYRSPERAFVCLPFLLLTPRLIADLEVGHNGESSQELVITTALCGLLLWLSLRAQQTSAWSLYRTGTTRYLLWALSGFTVWSALSWCWTMDVGATQDHTVLWVNYVALIVSGRLVLRRRSIMGLLATTLTTGVGVALFRLAQYWSAADSRPITSAIYKNYGVEAELLITVLPLAAVSYLTLRRRTLARSTLGAAALLLMGGVSTYQRAPLLACLAAGGILLLGLGAKWIRPYSYGRVIALAITLFAAAGLQYALPSKNLQPTQQDTGAAHLVKQIKGIRTLEVDTSSRLQFWGTALEMARAHPLQGIGAGAFKTGYVSYRSRANAHPLWGQVQDFSQTEGAASVYRTHNEWLQILSELGLIGLTLIACLIAGLGSLLWQTKQRWLALAVSASAVAFFLSSSLTSYSLRWIPCGLLFFLIVALLLPLHPLPALRVPRRYGQPLLVATSLLLLLGVVRSGQVLGSEYYQAQAAQQPSSEAVQAIALYQKALAFDRYNFSAAAELGTLYYRQRQPQAAALYLADGVRHGVNDIFSHARLSCAYAQLGQPTRAREVLQQAVEAYPGTIFTRVLYAEALAKEGNESAAQAQRALMQATHPQQATSWELIVQQGFKAATLTAARQQLPHFIKLEPKNGLGFLQERERLLQQ